MFASGEDMELSPVVKEECPQPSDEKSVHPVFSVYSVGKEDNIILTTTNTVKTIQDLPGDDLISECEIKVEVDVDDLGNGHQSKCKVNADTVIVNSGNGNQSKDNRESVPDHDLTTEYNIDAPAAFKTVIMKYQFPIENAQPKLIVRKEADNKDDKIEVDNKLLNLNNSSCNMLYSCDRCTANFETAKELRIHKRTHKDDVYKCDKCEYSSRRTQKLKMHQDVHRSVFYKCEFCGKIIEVLHNLKTHIKVKHNKKPKSTYPEIKDNCTEISFNNSYPCVVCTLEFNTKRLLSNHMRTHKKTCPKCNRTFENTTYLKQHMLTHFYEDQPRAYSCKKCDIDYTDTEALNHHMSLSHPMDTVKGPVGPKLFACDLCNKIFPSEFHLRMHKKQHKYKRVKRFACTLCDRVFDRRSRLEDHKLVHVGQMQKRFLCERCGVLFSQIRNLDRHMLLHKSKVDIPQENTMPNSGPVKPDWNCSKCGKIFGRKDYLRQHEYRVHTHRELGCCELCGKVFNLSKDLEVHMERHGQEFNYSCNICSKRFKTKSNLRKHVSVHTTPVDIKRERRRARYERALKRAEDAKSNKLQIDKNTLEENAN